MDDKPISVSYEEWFEQRKELPLPDGYSQTTLWPAETQR